MKAIKCMVGAEPFFNTKWGKRAGFLWTALVLLLASICVGFISLYFAVKYGYPMFQTYFHVKGLVALNILPVVLLAFFLACIWSSWPCNGDFDGDRDFLEYHQYL